MNVLCQQNSRGLEISVRPNLTPASSLHCWFSSIKGSNRWIRWEELSSPISLDISIHYLRGSEYSLMISTCAPGYWFGQYGFGGPAMSLPVRTTRIVTLSWKRTSGLSLGAFVSALDMSYMRSSFAVSGLKFINCPSVYFESLKYWGRGRYCDELGGWYGRGGGGQGCEREGVKNRGGSWITGDSYASSSPFHLFLYFMVVRVRVLMNHGWQLR